MAKQSSIYKFTGRLGDDLVGYRLKYTVPQIVRTIDRTALSTAVKEGANYANTRKNASEFGAAGNTASALLRSIPTRWKSILNPYSQAKLCKDLFALRTQTAANYGKRVPAVNGSTLLGVADRIESLQKNDFGELYGGSNAVRYVTDSTPYEFSLIPSVLAGGSVYTSGDYDGIAAYLFTSRIFLGYYNDEGDWMPGYINSVASTSLGIYFDCDNYTNQSIRSIWDNKDEFDVEEAPLLLNGNTVQPMTYNNAGSSGTYTKSVTGGVILLQPFKIINNTPVEFVEQAAYVWPATSTETSDNITGNAGTNAGTSGGSAGDSGNGSTSDDNVDGD